MENNNNNDKPSNSKVYTFLHQAMPRIQRKTKTRSKEFGYYIFSLVLS